MAFDDLRISEYDLLSELLKAYKSGRYNPEFNASRIEGVGWLIKLEGVNGNTDKEISGFSEGDIIGLSTKNYLNDKLKPSGHVLTLSSKAFEQLNLSGAAFRLQSPEDAKSKSGEDKFGHANQLYSKVKSLIHDTKPLDQNTAKLIIELADDAIREYGNTNQEKKVELRDWKEKAATVLPPGTLEELKKRAEGQLLKKSYPKNKILRNVLLVVIASIVSILGLRALWHVLPSLTSSNSLQELEDLPKDGLRKLSHVEVKAVNRSLEFNVLNETEWTVKELSIEFTALDSRGQRTGYKNNFRMELSPDNSGEPHKVSKFVAESERNWGNISPKYEIRIIGAKGIKPVDKK